ncbi:hypothetical protein H8S37_01590 [Mediterraneibacter sp. NSJ-55]|uniref:Streptococcal pilin isopeptide linkage domain-containing protein n=1 Tax=Mediterraneibacter hominis TaxID=2763054 RepID=A0A923RNP0_9FIRM|nr:FctA domain-containing protein [Mediterraneibacter hominis]MBC5687629.1 hypothetical protein [Mediterraneibacter hominis]
MRCTKKAGRFLLLLLMISACVIPASEVKAQADKAVAQIPVEKRINGDMPDTEPAFSIQIIPEKEEYPLPEEGTEILLKNGEKEQITISYTRTGVYTYILCEKQGNLTGYTYDKRQYRLKVEVLNAENGLKAVVSIREIGDVTGEKKDAAVFNNEYRISEAEKVTDENVQTGDKTKQGLSICIAVALFTAVIAAGLKRWNSRSGK